MAKEVVIRIAKDKSTDEYKVIPKIDGIDFETQTYYTTDPEDAVATLRSMAKRMAKDGFSVRECGDALTKHLLREYPDDSKGMLGSDYNNVLSDLKGEHKAIADYKNHIEETKDSDIASVLSHIKGEEEQHVEELQGLMKKKAGV